jgi:hypothetical protein
MVLRKYYTKALIILRRQSYSKNVSRRVAGATTSGWHRGGQPGQRRQGGVGLGQRRRGNCLKEGSQGQWRRGGRARPVASGAIRAWAVGQRMEDGGGGETAQATDSMIFCGTDIFGG